MTYKAAVPAPILPLIEAAGFDLACYGNTWEITGEGEAQTFKMSGPSSVAEVRVWVAWRVLLREARILHGEVKRRAKALGAHSSMEDICQAGLLKAHRIVQGWDPARGTLSVYARQSIRYGVGIAIQESLPSNEARISSLHYALDKGWQSWRQEKGSNPTLEELASYSAQFSSGRTKSKKDVPWRHVLSWAEHGNVTKAIPLHTPIGDDGTSTLMDTLSDDAQSPEDRVANRELLEAVLDRIEALPERELNILRLQLEGKNNSEIGRALELSRERVRQITGKTRKLLLAFREALL
jgi:RNA polymerase sigma factor (sigma-70 family)